MYNMAEVSHLRVGFLVVSILSLSSRGCAMCKPYGYGSATPTEKGVSLMPVWVYCRLTVEILFCNYKIAPVH